MSTETITYEGDDIMIEEMPQGCVLMGYGDHNTIVIASTQDALAVIESLQRMLKIQLGEDEE